MQLSLIQLRLGAALRRGARLHSARLNPLLARLLERGWLVDGRDESSPADAQRYYVLTDVGRRALARP